jgi:hypothetical protein
MIMHSRLVDSFTKVLLNVLLPATSLLILNKCMTITDPLHHICPENCPLSEAQCTQRFVIGFASCLQAINHH